MAAKIPGAEPVEQLIRDIIARGSAYDTAALNGLYDDALQVVRVGADGVVRISDKEDTLRTYRTLRESGAPPLSLAAKVRVTAVDAERAHAIVIREMQVEGMPRRLVFSLDCACAGGRWRVTREVAVAQL